MDWAIIIGFGLGLPLVGSAIGAIMVGRKYNNIKKNPMEFGLDGEEAIRKNFGRYMTIQNLFATGPVYGLLVISLFWTLIGGLDTPDETLTLFGVATALAIGVPAFFCNISRGLISKEGVESVVREPRTFGRAIVHATIVETPMIYGLLIAILAFSASGLFYGEQFSLTDYQLDEMFSSILIFSCLSSGILLSGILLNKVEEPFSMPNFPKGIQVNALGTIPPIIGLMYVIIRFMDIGVL